MKLQEFLLERLMHSNGQEMMGYAEQINNMEQEFISQAELVRSADARRQEALDKAEQQTAGTSRSSVSADVQPGTLPLFILYGHSCNLD